MLDHDRERILYRILSGKTILSKLQLEVRNPTLDLLYEAEEIYAKYYNKNGVLNREDLQEKLLNNGTITKLDFSFFQGFQKNIEEKQKELCNNFYNIPVAEGIRKLIQETRNKYNTIVSDLSKYDTYSKEGISNYAKSMFLIRNTTYRNNILYDFIDKQPILVMDELNQKVISSNDIREVAKKSSWNNTWFAIKGTGVMGFPSIEQQLLIMWSKIYDSIRESQDCPSDDLIQDDDALDGWLLIQKESSEKKKLENTKKLRANSKIQNADEVFIIPRDPETNEVSFKKENIDRINRLNQANSQRIKQERLQQIYNKGEVHYHNFLDVRRDIQAEFHKMHMDHVRKGK